MVSLFMGGIRVTRREETATPISAPRRRTLTRAEPSLKFSSEARHGSLAAKTLSSSAIHNALSTSSTNEPSKLLRNIV
jgi:hypothetical protein